MKNETGNIVGNLRHKIIFKISEHKTNFSIEKFGRGNSVNWNYTDLILNWSQKYSESIYLHPDHNKSNQPIPYDLTNIGSIHHSDNIFEIENILAPPVHSPVHAPPIFNYGNASDPPSPPQDSSAE